MMKTDTNDGDLVKRDEGFVLLSLGISHLVFLVFFFLLSSLNESQRNWEGGWTIQAVKSPVTVKVSDGQQTKVVHVNCLRYRLIPLQSCRLRRRNLHQQQQDYYMGTYPD